MKLSSKAIIALVGVLLSTFVVTGAAYAATQNGTRPGWGYGDKNHVHTGPPGQSVRP
jgi:hypothetical protein